MAAAASNPSGRVGAPATPAAAAQFDASRSWAVMALYWAVGYAVGQRCSYLTELWTAPLLPELTPAGVALTFVALVLTLGTQVLYFKSTSSMGRQLSLFSMLLFPPLNGVLESCLFFFTFDLGAAAASGLGSHLASFCCGFLSFSVYSGFIHATMWDKLVFPPHLESRDPSKPRLPTRWLIMGLSVMSLSWLLLYSLYRALWLFVLLHVLVDICANLAIHLPPPPF